MSRPIMKELALETCKENLDDVANFLDNAHEFKKVKTKYAKEGWDVVSLHGYGTNPEDILKPNCSKKFSKRRYKTTMDYLRKSCRDETCFKFT